MSSIYNQLNLFTLEVHHYFFFCAFTFFSNIIDDFVFVYRMSMYVCVQDEYVCVCTG